MNGISVSNTKSRLAEAYTCAGSCTSKITDLWYSYSKRGELTDAYEVTPHSGGTYHLTQSYWEHGGPKALAGLPGLPTITYGAADGTGLDSEGRVTKITASTGTNPLTGATYVLTGTTQPIGAITQLTFGSADTDNFSYDSVGRVTQYKFNIGATPQSVIGNLTWNANSSLKMLQITDPFNAANAQTCNFAYDDLARQSTANCGTAWNQTFSFDPFGNISKSATVGTSFNATYAPATNRISTIGSLVPTYDANGNLSNDTSHAYSWDAEGKMLNVDSGTSSGVCGTYDALGRMVEKGTGTTCTSSYTEIVYAPSGIRLATMTGQTLQQASVPLLNGTEAVYNSSGVLAYRHSDHLGSSRFASTPARTKYYDVAYAPYGEDYAGSGTADLSFTGQKKDTASWLYDFMFRKYNAAHGRWMSPDPAGIGASNPGAPQSWNRYAYVANGPMSAVDPLGLECTIFGPDGSQQPCGGGGKPDIVRTVWGDLPDYMNSLQHLFDVLSSFVNTTLGDPRPTREIDPPAKAANNAQSRLNQIINHLQQCGGVYSLVAAAAGNFKIGSIPPNQPGLLPLAVTSATDVSFGIFNGGNSTTTIDAVNFANQDPATQTGVVVHEWFHTMQINNNPMFLFTNGLSQKLPSSLGGGFIENQANAAAAEAIKQCGPG